MGFIKKSRKNSSILKLKLMSDTLQQAYCLYCGKPVKGRIDKKFCDDWCRNA